MTTSTTENQSTSSYEDNFSYDYGDEYMYPGYTFERPVYLYVWEILVIVMFIQNLLTLSVFLRRTMRSPTNFILSAIAISDSLAGLVTLPTYIMVFQRYDPLHDSILDYGDNFANHSRHIFKQQIERSLGVRLYPNNSTFNQSIDDHKQIDNYFGVIGNSVFLFTTAFSAMTNGTRTSSSAIFHEQTLPPVDGYTLSKNLCRGFMISKYFLSKSFHTVSIFLTLFLEIQRYVSMAYPYRYDTCFNRFRIVKVYCISAFVLCPFLHAYHLRKEKAVDGLCQWEMSVYGCGRDCIYLWVAFVIRHFIPCVTLVIFTVLFIRQLRKGEKNFRRTDSNSSQYSRRIYENRRISLVVTVVVVVRLVPEIPYSIFLLNNSIDATVYSGRGIDLETNRIFHMTYEISLVFSFIANFYIYLIVNKSFRRHLFQTFIEPARRHLSSVLKFNVFQCSSSRNVTQGKSCSAEPEIQLEMKSIQSGFSVKEENK